MFFNILPFYENKVILKTIVLIFVYATCITIYYRKLFMKITFEFSCCNAQINDLHKVLGLKYFIKIENNSMKKIAYRCHLLFLHLIY